MNRKFPFFAAALVAVTIAGGMIAQPARAQSQGPVLIKNVDEAGRTPYTENQTQVCNQQVCNLTFLPIPAGKRLVVQHVSAGIGIPTGSLRLTALAEENAQWFLPARSISDPTFQMVNEQVLAYFETGKAPVFRVVTTTLPQVVFINSTITGYLVDLTK